jgi:hypothetical protein
MIDHADIPIFVGGLAALWFLTDLYFGDRR